MPPPAVQPRYPTLQFEKGPCCRPPPRRYPVFFGAGTRGSTLLGADGGLRGKGPPGTTGRSAGAAAPTGRHTTPRFSRRSFRLSSSASAQQGNMKPESAGDRPMFLAEGQRCPSTRSGSVLDLDSSVQRGSSGQAESGQGVYSRIFETTTLDHHVLMPLHVELQAITGQGLPDETLCSGTVRAESEEKSLMDKSVMRSDCHSGTSGQLISARDVAIHITDEDFLSSGRPAADGDASDLLTVWSASQIVANLLLIGPLVVVFWRGWWAFLDVVMFPDDPAMSVVSGFATGTALMLLCLAVRRPRLVHWAQNRYGTTVCAVAERFYTLACAVSVIWFWRGIWDACDLWLLPENPASSALICMLIGTMGLVCTNSLRAATSTPLGYLRDGVIGAWDCMGPDTLELSMAVRRKKVTKENNSK